MRKLLERLLRARKVFCTAETDPPLRLDYHARLRAYQNSHHVRAIHTLLAGAAGRLHYILKEDNTELLSSRAFDATAGLLFADWLVLGRAMVAQGWRRTLDAYEAQLIVDHPAPPLEAAGGLLFKLAELERAEQQAFWRQGATVFAVVSGASGLVATPAQAEAAREALQRSVRAAGVGGIEVLPTALEFKELSRTLKDYGFEGLKIMLIRELCNLFSIDSSLLNDPENKTYSNKELAEQALFVNVVIPQAHHFIYSFTLSLRAQGDLRTTIEVDSSNIEALAQQKREHARFIIELFKTGLLSKEEALQKLEL